MTRNKTTSRPSPAGEGLATLLEAMAEGARLLYIGDGAGLERLARGAERILHLTTGEERPATKPANVQQRKLKGGRIAFRPGSFDLVVVPDLTVVPGHPEDVILDLAEIADTGLLALGVPFVDREKYADFVELVDDLLDEPRLFGVGAFEGLRISELGVQDDEVVVSSLAEVRAPAHVFAIAGAYDDLPASVLSEGPPSAVASPVRTGEVERLEEALADALERAEEIPALERDLAFERARVDELVARERSLDDQVKGLERDLKKLTDKLERERARAASMEGVAAEQRVLESRLEARGDELRELRVEVDRRGIIVRDLVEELRELRRRGTGGSEDARERVLRAEARAEASSLEVDELRARVLELEEEIERARSAAVAPPVASDTLEAEASPGLPDEIRAALGERDGLALRVKHLEAALDAAKGAALDAAKGADRAAPGDDARIASLQAQIMETRAGAEATKHALESQGELVRRLQRDLAATEVALRAAEERTDHDFGEISRLRDALLEAVTQADRANAEAASARAELERLRAGQEALRASEAAALESADAARRALVEAKAALVELESKSAGHQ